MVNPNVVVFRGTQCLCPACVKFIHYFYFDHMSNLHRSIQKQAIDRHGDYSTAVPIERFQAIMHSLIMEIEL